MQGRCRGDVGPRTRRLAGRLALPLPLTPWQATGQSYALKGMRKEQIVEMKQQKNILNEKKILVRVRVRVRVRVS